MMSIHKLTFIFFFSLTNLGKTESDFYDEIPIILRELLYRLNDDDEAVLVATNNAFTSLSKHVPSEVLVEHIEFIRNLIASMVSESRRRKGGVGDGEFLLPGFNRPKGEFLCAGFSWQKSENEDHSNNICRLKIWGH